MRKYKKVELVLKYWKVMEFNENDDLYSLLSQMIEKISDEVNVMKRLTYDYEGKHYCDYETRDIINRLAECEIMLEKIEQIIKEWEQDDIDYEGHYGEDYMQKISEVMENGKIN